MNNLTKLIEAALFSSAHAVSVGELRKLSSDATADDITQSLAELKALLDDHGHGIELVEVAEGFQLLTRPELADAIADAKIVSRPRKLSTAALETLAIIGYKQPVGRSEIEEIRGVAADGVLKSLHERNLIEVVGRSEGLGRPLLYGTTPRFLEMMGLKTLLELPNLEDLAVALRPLGPVEVGEVQEELDDGVVVEPRVGEDFEDLVESSVTGEEAVDEPSPLGDPEMMNSTTDDGSAVATESEADAQPSETA